MALTERWVNDQLFDILGISDKYIAQYFIGLASKAGSPEEFVEQLKETQTVDVDNNLIAFAKDLYNRVRHNKSNQYPRRRSKIAGTF